MPTLFDPLRFLRSELHAEPSIGPQGIILRFDGRVTPNQLQKSKSVVRVYEKLLRLQLENGGASVQKLIAWGKLKLRGGKYVPG